MSDRDKKEFSIVKYSIQRAINDLKFERKTTIDNIKRKEKEISDTEASVKKDTARILQIAVQIDELQKAAADLGIDVTDGTN